MSLREKAKGLNAGEGIPFMKDRTKGDVSELIGKEVTIRDFDFIAGDNGEYVCFIVDEIADTFYFGGSVLTNNLKSLLDDKEEIKAEGLPVLLETAKSKNKRNYTKVTFYPNDKELPF